MRLPATKRFQRDIAVLNFYFDTPTISQVTWELRTNLFDRFSAVGGTLGLFTGISVITLIEIIWWIAQFCHYAIKHRTRVK